jgi:hypothetical protein
LSSSYEYYIFKLDDTTATWLELSSSEAVSSVSDLVSKANTAIKGGSARTYYLAQPDIGLAKLNSLNSENQRRDAASKAASESKKQAVQSKLDGLDIGDGVYVQGFFSDELVYIVRIDKEKNSVKVRQSQDGYTKWVSGDDIISKEASTVNDAARVGVGIGIMVCLFNPEACQDK